MSNTEKTMTTEEYIRKQNQIDLDAEFDKALKQAYAKQKAQQELEDNAKKISDFIFKLTTAEAELIIWEEMLDEKIKYNKHPEYSFHDLNKQIAQYEIRYTKLKNKLDKLLESDDE